MKNWVDLLIRTGMIEERLILSSVPNSTHSSHHLLIPSVHLPLLNSSLPFLSNFKVRTLRNMSLLSPLYSPLTDHILSPDPSYSLYSRSQTPSCTFPLPLAFAPTPYLNLNH